MTDIRELIKQKQQDIKAKTGRQRTVKPKQGRSVWRILPSWRTKDGSAPFWHDFGSHFIKDKAGQVVAVYVCAEKTFNRECAVCAAISQGMATTKNDDLIKQLKEAQSGQRYLMNALELSDAEKKGEPQILEIGNGLFMDIANLINEYGDITDINSGIDIVIQRTGSSVKDTKYTVMPSPKSAPVPKAVLDKLIDLDDYVAQENEAGLRKAVAAIAQKTGVALPAPGTAAASSGPIYDEASVFEDAAGSKPAFDEELPEDFGSVTTGHEAGQPASESSGDDDIDALLAGL